MRLFVNIKSKGNLVGGGAVRRIIRTVMNATLVGVAIAAYMYVDSPP